MKRSILLLCIFIGSGCATSKYELFETEFQMVEYTDGISRDEAILIAKNVLIEKDQIKYYDFENPEEFTDLDNVKNAEKFWFITFKEGTRTSIKTRYLIAVQKESGKVVFSRVYYSDSKWALEAYFFNLDFPKG